MIIIREANYNDLEGIARVHVESWRSTYTGIVSEVYLSKLTLETRKKNWEWTFNHLDQDDKIFVAEDEGKIVGFSTGGRNRVDTTEYEGELYAIYILQEYQGKGIGKKLVQEVMNALKEMNYLSMLVWVLELNPAMAFYRKLGGEVLTRKEIKIGENLLFEVALGWRNLDLP
ncbi:GNAT family N-acetyltransferase [Paenibacillus sp. J2TS4]|uniref:GNAT family N-acetyltransferase n=1 Tax=Paenibacillus sp. J2TS4 TaxID=2807194 RepID=UPI0020C055B3|nr:GNAT family N-acetyltransferase [Paenibacillus sp. J2TS4]